jgi:hypothetical protein
MPWYVVLHVSHSEPGRRARMHNDKYLMPDEAAAHAQAKDMNEKNDLPGVTYFAEFHRD